MSWPEPYANDTLVHVDIANMRCEYRGWEITGG